MIYGGGSGAKFSFLRYLHMQAENVLLTHQLLFEPLMRQALELVPDAVLHDSYAYWGKQLAAVLSLPAAALIPNYLIPRQAFQA